MPFWPGTGIPYGISPFAFSTGTAEARRTVGVAISSLARLGGRSSGVGDTSAGFRFRELGRRDIRLVFFSAGLGVGRGWKAFETDWPTFLKKSPTGSASTHRAVNKNSAVTGNETQRERKERLLELSAFNVKTRFSLRVRAYEKKNFPAQRFWRLIKRNNATGATGADRQSTRQIFRHNHHQEY